MGGEVRLGDVAKVQGGFAFRSKDFEPVGIPVVKIKNVRKRDVDLTEVDCVSENIAKRCLNFYVRKGDVLISMTGSGPNAPASIVGRVARHTGEDADFLINQRVGRFVNKDTQKLDLRYLYYFLSQFTVQDYLVSIATGSANQVNISAAQIESLNVSLPVLNVQKAIAHILGSLDDKIELNHQMNTTLEAMAQALFKSWFVDFDPVIDNALAAGNPIPEPLQARAETRKALGGKRKPLPKAIQQQFPSCFVLSEEMGWIPEGWEEVRVKDIAKVIKGKSYKSSELEESKTALVTLKSFNRGGGYRLDGLKEYTGTFKHEQEVFAGDLIIAYTDVTQAADVIGKPAMVVSDSRYEHLVVSLDVSVVRPAVDAHKYFLYGIAQTERFQDHTYSHSTGTTVLHLGKNAVPEYLIALPDEELVNTFVKIAEPTFQLIDKQIAEIGQLSMLRDTLLPKLLSGQLRVSDIKLQLTGGPGQ